jgi:hypothetical protein
MLAFILILFCTKNCSTDMTMMVPKAIGAFNSMNTCQEILKLVRSQLIKDGAVGADCLDISGLQPSRFNSMCTPSEICLTDYAASVK